MERDYVGVELRVLSNLIMRQVGNDMKRMNLDELTGTNGMILEFLMLHQGKGVFQKDVEKAFGTTRSTMSKVLLLMEQKGYISRECVPYDARLKRIFLTKKGTDACVVMSGRMEVMEELLTKGFSLEEKKMLLSYIERMKENVS